MEKEIQTVQNIQLKMIDRPVEPDRIEIDQDAIDELAASIKEIGLMNPIGVQQKDGRYEIIYGDRRFLACKQLGFTEISAQIYNVESGQMSILRATENLQRENLTPIEEGNIYRRLHEVHGLTWEQIGKRTGISGGTVKRRYDLLKLPKCLVDAVHQKKISTTVAEELAYLPSLDKVKYYLGYCIDHGVTAHVARQWVNDEKAAERNRLSGDGEGGWSSPMVKSLPVYTACNLCEEAMEIGSETVLRICKGCANELKRICEKR